MRISRCLSWTGNTLRWRHSVTLVFMQQIKEIYGEFKMASAVIT